MKIAFVNTNQIVCGGILTNLEYVKELKKRGIDARLYASEPNRELLDYYGLEVYPIESLQFFTNEDIIIAVRWEQIEELEQYKGRKFQFVQGKDVEFYKNHTELPKLIQARNNKNWELIGVSQYCLDDWDRGTVIANGVSDRFFVDHKLERDIAILFEGNQEENKGYKEAFDILGNIE